MNCRFIDTGFNDAFTNMAIDEALAINSTMPILRVYQWKPKAVSIGYNQNIQKEINLDYCKKSNIDVVRRITGGKAVFHDKELTYSFILPENINLLPKDIVESYKIIAEALIIGLKKIGINANIRKINEKIKTPSCFNSSNWYELMVNNKKISGSAQRRMNGIILQHGPILMDFDYGTNLLLFNSGNDFDSVENLKKRITSIKKELSNNGKNNEKTDNDKNKNDYNGTIKNSAMNKNSNNKDFDINELKKAVKHGFERNFNFKLTDDNLSNEEILLAKKLLEGKYKTDEWNLGLVKAW